jgi:hypothetical protein
MSKPELYMTLSATRRLALKGRWPAPSLPLFPSRPRRRQRPARFGHSRRSADRTATQVRPARQIPRSANRHEGGVHPGVRLRRRRRIAGHAQDRPCLAGRLHLRAGQDPHQRHRHPHRQREEDAKFTSKFITADPAIKALADLKGKTFAFGAPSSTSGSLMPRFFLQQAGLNPEKDFKNVAFSGAHDATVAFVAAGKADAGVLNASVWDKLVEQKKVDTDKVRVFATTPPYFDYNWTVRGDLDPALVKKLTDAFLKLDPANPEHKEIMACSARRSSSRPRRKTTTASKRPPSRPAC